MIRAVAFDFGGVIAEEGFREGLKAVGRRNGLDADRFFRMAEDAIHSTGYVTGEADEASYWAAVRMSTGISESDENLRREILPRFTLRKRMLQIAEKTKQAGFVTVILSDQTDWLDEINRKTPFYHLFDYVFNSFKTGKSKRDPAVFRDVCSVLNLNPEEVLFIDDNPANIENASREGLKTIHFTDMVDFEQKLHEWIGPLPASD